MLLVGTQNGPGSDVNDSGGTTSLIADDINDFTRNHFIGCWRDYFIFLLIVDSSIAL